VLHKLILTYVGTSAERYREASLAGALKGPIFSSMGAVGDEPWRFQTVTIRRA
jgi:hypothetical protein